MNALNKKKIIMYWNLLRPVNFMITSFRLLQQPIGLGFTFFVFIIAFYLSTLVAPSDFQQGESYRIIFLHVPAAWMSLFFYILISITSLFYLLTNHPIFHFFTIIGTKIGILSTIITLITGSLWGKPMWGTFWVWDARLTSVLILLFIYIGALAFGKISPEIGSIFICIGLINIPIIKFSVNWWNTLHQPSSISPFGSSIHLEMLFPIFLMFSSFLLVAFMFVFIEIRKSVLLSFSESLAREKLKK